MNTTTSATQRFQIGQKVNAIAFTNCFGKPVGATNGLTVTDVRLIEGGSIPDYYRYTARADWKMVEGAERFFTEAACERCHEAGGNPYCICAHGLIPAPVVAPCMTCGKQPAALTATGERGECAACKSGHHCDKRCGREARIGADLCYACGTAAEVAN